MKRIFFLCFSLFLFTASVNALTVSVNCNKPGPYSKIGNVLKMLPPQGPNTINVTGTCKENLYINQFDRLSLIAVPGAAIEDASEGQQAVIDIRNSRRITVQGFTIAGGSNGVVCGDGSFCTFSGNTIERSAGTGLFVDHSQVDLYGDIFQDNQGAGLAFNFAHGYAADLTIQRNHGTGVALGVTDFESYNVNVIDNEGDLPEFLYHSE